MKYPRTFHLPSSNSITSDDKIINDLSILENCNVVATEKLDGENTSFLSNKIHARSIDSRHHSSRNWVKSLWATINYKIPIHFQIVGENMYAMHSIYYDKLESYFYGFCVIENNNLVLSWEDTLYILDELGLLHVPIIGTGGYHDVIKLCDKFIDNGINSFVGDEGEGYVIRNTDSFLIKDFSNNVVKYVRDNHVKTDTHWTTHWKKNNLIK